VKKEQPVVEQRRKSGNGHWEIARNIAVPETLIRREPRGYPYHDLEVGESFLVQASATKSARDKFRLKNKIQGKRFVSRTVIEDGVVGVRVWRVE
jgi:hypothetical protein